MKNRILQYIYEKAPMQEKKISKALSDNPAMDEALGSFLAMYSVYMKAEKISCEDLADAYLLMVNQMMQARVEFVRTGKYPVACQGDATREVYSDRRVMTNYMLGLALSQFLWKHHFAIFRFFIEQLTRLRPSGDFLEVGSGHGLFALELMKHNGGCDSYDIVDISETSLDITRRILDVVSPHSLEAISFYNSDINDFQADKLYDFISMGEVLEHVDDPAKILRTLNGLLKPAGKMFITTCVNSPAIDHVYHFRSIREIIEMIEDCNLIINEDIVVPSEDKSPELIEKYKLDVLYAAILEKKEK